MQGKFRPTFEATFFSLLMFTVLMALGTWQVQRLEWKTELMALVQEQMKKPAVPMPEKIADPAAWEYRRVTLAGRFLYDHEFLLKPRTLDGVSGYHMIVPFQRASGGTVMVNRGWISDALMQKANRPKGLLQIEGIVQLPHKNSFTPLNNPARNDWYWTDVDAMAAAAKLKNPAPVVVAIAAKTPGVYPVGGKVENVLSNNHKQYAIFWYLMALISQVVFFLRFWVRE